MSIRSFNEIGGYFGLEIQQNDNTSDNNIYLNCARNCLRYVIKSFNIKEIYIPYYTCPVVWQVVQKENCKMYFYHIDEHFMPIIDASPDAFILYTNYFGVCAKNVKTLAKKYKNLIVDNAQAFYMPKYGIASFNSIRKFFGVPDGAVLYSDKILNNYFEQDTSYQRCAHLLKRTDVSARFGYEDFCHNDESFTDAPIKLVSNLTRYIFNGCDIEKAREKRLVNFDVLSKKLAETNLLKLNLDRDDVPMVYPYLVKNEKLRTYLIKNKIYVAQYWSPMESGTVEADFQKYIIPLPIDQRYTKDDMNTILEVINAHN